MLSQSNDTMKAIYILIAVLCCIPLNMMGYYFWYIVKLAFYQVKKKDKDNEESNEMKSINAY